MDGAPKDENGLFKMPEEEVWEGLVFSSHINRRNMEQVSALETRENDVFVVGYPKTGQSGWVDGKRTWPVTLDLTDRTLLGPV